MNKKYNHITDLLKVIVKFKMKNPLKKLMLVRIQRSWKGHKV